MKGEEGGLKTLPITRGSKGKEWTNNDFGRTTYFVGSRNQTTFFWEAGFKDIYTSLNSVPRAKVLSHTQRFEMAWRGSTIDHEIPGSFDFTPYPTDEPYRLVEIHLGYDYRAFVMFPDRRQEAYWIHLFKKTGQKVPLKEINLAKSRAKDCWNRITRSS